MRRVSSTITALALATLFVLTPAERAFARGHATAEWTHVDSKTSGKEGERVAKALKNLLKDASKKADFGKTGKVALRARITEYVVEKRGDVLRIRCTVVGRLEGGPSAKSRISFGGDPNDPKGLEKQVLTMVAHGVTSRLAALAKAQEAEKAASKKHAP